MLSAYVLSEKFLYISLLYFLIVINCTMGNKHRVGSRRKCYRKKTVKATSSKEPLPSTSSPEQIRPRPTSTDSHKDSSL